MNGASHKNTSFTVWETSIASINFESYSTDAPIEQVLFHWERRHLLPFSKILSRFLQRLWDRNTHSRGFARSKKRFNFM